MAFDDSLHRFAVEKLGVDVLAERQIELPVGVCDFEKAEIDLILTEREFQFVHERRAEEAFDLDHNLAATSFGSDWTFRAEVRWRTVSSYSMVYGSSVIVQPSLMSAFFTAL